jgi:PAS domain S-box-containing protein
MTVRDLPERVWAGLALIVVPFALLIGLEIYQAAGRIPALQRSREQVANTFAVITSAQALNRALEDAERGQRGYLLTSDATYLEPYRTGSRDTPALLAKLKQLIPDDDQQEQRRLKSLEQAINLKFAELAKTIETHDQEGPGAALQIVRTNAGRDAMQDITASIDAIIESENALLNERAAAVVSAERSAVNLNMVGAGLALVTMSGGAWLALLAFRNLRDTEQTRNRSERRFGALVSGVKDYAIYMLDPEGYITHWNAGAQRIKGYAADEIIGKHFSTFYTPEDRNANLPQQALQSARQAGKYEAEGWRVRKDGSRFFANVLLDPLLEDGRLIGFAKITRDVTERRAQQMALDQAKAELAQSQKMEALGQLSGGVAHDFNNLLAVMKNCVEILRRRLGSMDADVEQTLDMIERNTDRAASLTQRLLAFSRRLALQPVPVDPNRLVADMAALLRRALGESIHLETVLSGSAWLILADVSQLETVILNLAVNARDAMPNGGRLTIETANMFLDEAYAAAHEQLTPGQYAMIAVSDTGTGMAGDVVGKVFEPFFTTKEIGKGTGLGLSQVYGFIKQSGGHVKIYSELGEGTTIKIYLPRFLPREATETLAATTPVTPSISGQTILLVDDDEDVRASTAQLLRDLGYHVLVAPEAGAALEALDGSNIDLLLTDVGLPNGINGRQLADEVRRRMPAVKVLFATGYARNAFIHHGRLDQGVEMILKPFSHTDLASKIRQVLDSRINPTA